MDKSVVEVYVNQVQAICRRVYPTAPERSTGVEVFGSGAEIKRLDVWEMMPANLY